MMIKTEDLDLKNPIHLLIRQMRVRDMIIDKRFENEMAITKKMNEADPTGNTARDFQRGIYGGSPKYFLEYEPTTTPKPDYLLPILIGICVFFIVLVLLGVK